MKTIILVLFVALMLAGCDNSVGTDSRSNKDGTPNTFLVEVTTFAEGVETVECDRIFYTNLQHQGLILYRGGEIVKWVIPENLKSYRTQ